MMRAWMQGLIDGWREPRCLSMGMTYGDRRDEAYDHGVNAGQRLRSPRHYQAKGER